MISPSSDQLLLDSFRSWLITRRLSPSTVKNYISDLNRYFQTLSQENPFSYQALSSYLQHLYKNSSYPRYLASLRLFCQFGLDQKLISKNPLTQHSQTPKTTPIADVKVIIDEFIRHLHHLKTPPSTIRNYVNDLTQYLHWLEDNSTLHAP